MNPQKDGYYHKNFTYEGKRYHICAPTEQALMVKYGMMLQQLADGSLTLNQNSTVAHWADVWLKTYKEGNMTPKSFSTYRQKLNGYILPVIGRMRMKDVREVHLQRILNEERGLSFSHVSKLCMVVKSMFKRAYTTGIINRDPSAGLILPATKKGSHRSITAQERAAILAVANLGRHNACLYVKLMLFCGIRPGEAMALQWKDIDYKRALLHIEKAIESGSGEVKNPKTPAGVRDIPIPSALLADLQEYQRAHRKSPFETVLHQQRDKSKPHTESSLTSSWRSFKRLVDIQMGAKVYRNQVVEHGEPDELWNTLTPYCLRHTYCTDLQDAGVPINIAKYLMGHSDITVTANIYTHKTDNTLEIAASLIEQAMEG